MKYRVTIDEATHADIIDEISRVTASVLDISDAVSEINDLAMNTDAVKSGDIISIAEYITEATLDALAAIRKLKSATGGVF